MKWVKFGVSRNFLENPLRKWPGILHADISWASSELIGLWSLFVDFINFGTISTSWNGPNLGILVMLCGFSSLWGPFDWNWSYLEFLGIIWRTCESKCQGESRGIFPMLCAEFCLIVIFIQVNKACQIIWTIKILLFQFCCPCSLHCWYLVHL